MLLLPGLLLVLWGEPGLCLGGNAGFTFDGDVRQFAVHNHTVYVSTEDTLYQLSHDLVPVRTLSQSGILTNSSNNPPFTRVSGNGDATFRVNLLLPFPQNGTLVSCGVITCGYCEVLHLDDVTKVLSHEHIQVGSASRSSSIGCIGFLVNVSGQIYIQTGEAWSSKCHSDTKAVNLHNTNDKQDGGIFAFNTANMIKMEKSDVEFVDGFQIDSIIYLLSNVIQSNRVRLLWLEDKTTKAGTLTSLQVVNLTVPGKLVASAVVPGGPPPVVPGGPPPVVPGGPPPVVPGGPTPVLWGGVFSADGEPQRTELLLFDISLDSATLKSLSPVAVLFRQDLMTSVLAVRQKAWMVFFIGTADGQLIKLAVDNNYHTTCPSVLYKSNDDRRVFPKMHLDQVDLKHVYVVLQHQMQRLPVSTCGTRADVQRCWSAQDPYCVWCSSTQRCTFEDECPDSDWISVPDDVQKKMVSHSFTADATGRISLHVRTHVTAGQNALSAFTCRFLTRESGELCSPSHNFPQCTCDLPQSMLPAEGLHVEVRVRLGATELEEQLTVTNCSDITGPPTSATCLRCFEAGCHWNKSQCFWANHGVQDDGVCKRMDPEIHLLIPNISSISPDVVSFYGRNHAALFGFNLNHVTRVRLQANSDCTPKESPVWNNSGRKLTFHIPRTDKKGTVRVCVLLPDGSCHGDAEVTYKSSPSCTDVSPSSAWSSGGRTMTLIGSHMEFVESVVHDHAPLEVRPPRDINYQNLTYDTPAAGPDVSSSSVLVHVANETLACSTLVTYHPDPEFTSFTSTEAGQGVLINIQKKSDKLEIVPEELSVWGVEAGLRYPCIMMPKDTANETNYFICKIHKSPNPKFKQLLIMYGETTITLVNTSYHLYLLALLLIPCIILVGWCVFRSKRNKLTAKMNKRMEDLELDIRNDIRQGFVDLQTEKADLMESVGAIPFLDYKHFASRIFFPESEPLMTLCIKDIGQDGLKVQLNERCQGLSRLLQEQLFLTSMVHALEEQKSFTIKDKCALASLLTVALHNDLSYLTEVMEALLRDLTQKNSNSQPKLLLRRTESIVEKLLTNWMSICLYGFLRESVGQQLFLMVSALTQQTAKGPVDCVTERALYTLSEDWLLWQAPDFSSLKLKVTFATGRDGEVSEPLEVNALTCDSIEQLKEKILLTFRAKFGFPFNTPVRDVHIELQRDGVFVALQEVDSSSEVVGEVTMLNTLKHYKVPDGATIKVLTKKYHPPLSPQGSLKDDENFSGKYFHLIDPDVDEAQRKNPERKKFKLKEVHLTKLLSTKVAVHSFVENLFRSIWGTPHSRAPHAIKYFFDFLDAQADCMKITDPDVLHIWKTNSLPLRFWINILKNPQFVFDMEKTPQLDSCLSVIAQAFMDSFSLSDIQLGKHAPTNKLLYAKDIPKYKQEVKSYYKQIRDQPPITESEFKQFLQEESKKHENEFNEAAALRELYKFIQRYFTEIKEKLDQNGAPAELTEQLHDVKNSFDQQRSLLWE